MNNARQPNRNSSGAWSFLGILSFALLLAGSGAAQQQGTSSYSSKSDGKVRFVWSDNLHRTELSLDGKVEFTDDDTGIKRLSRDGRFYLKETYLSKTRELRVDPDRDGQPEYAYWVNGRTRDFDAEARGWLAEMLPTIIRESGIGAEKRVRRILSERGVDGVLDEIELIRSDNATRRYFKALVEHGNLDSSQRERTLRQAADQIASDSHMARFLKTVSQAFLADKGLIDPYLDAVNTIRSDSHRRSVLGFVLERDSWSKEVQVRLLRSVKAIRSDSHKAALLRKLADSYALNDRELQKGYFDVIEGIRSDSHRRNTLSALLRRSPLEMSLRERVLRSVSTIRSDSHKSALLADFAERGLAEKDTHSSYMEAASSIRSDSHRRNALTALLHRGAPAKLVQEAILHSIRTMNSDSHKSTLMIAVAEQGFADDDVRSFYLSAASSINSDSHRRRALEKLLAAGKLGPDLQIQFLETVRAMRSDSHKAQLLVNVSRVLSDDDAVDAAFQKALDSLRSSSQYRRVVSARGTR